MLLVRKFYDKPIGVFQHFQNFYTGILIINRGDGIFLRVEASRRTNPYQNPQQKALNPHWSFLVVFQFEKNREYSLLTQPWLLLSSGI